MMLVFFINERNNEGSINENLIQWFSLHSDNDQYFRRNQAGR